jgi:hypothetical protein
MVLYYYGR